MPSKARLNITVSDPELQLLKSVAPSRKLSEFIRSAAVEKAHRIQREEMRRQIVAAYEADPEYLKSAGAAWDEISVEHWPEP